MSITDKKKHSNKKEKAINFKCNAGNIHYFSLPKTVYYCKITCNVQYSCSPYIVAELTVNQTIGF